ncbi:MAG: hypothetical protein ACTS4T_01570 [Candidatus Hodgkinia cicadicola]
MANGCKKGHFGRSVRVKRKFGLSGNPPKGLSLCEGEQWTCRPMLRLGTNLRTDPYVRHLRLTNFRRNKLPSLNQLPPE